jgi:uncharacterized protein YndB with AHSA1/START domain
MRRRNVGDAAAKKRHQLYLDAPLGQPIILFRREFDFPRDFVWDVYTEGSHMKHWWGPAKYDTVVHEFENYRFIDIGGGRTRIESVSHFPDVASRDAIAQGGMEEGAIETYERLDDLLEKLSQKPASKAGKK